MECSYCGDTRSVDMTQRLGGKELKFVVPAERAEGIRAWARRKMMPDLHAVTDDQYRVRSLYLDTPQFEVFRQIGSYGRAKFRVRQYNGAPVVFLERKLKTHSLVSKRRSQVPLQTLDLLERQECTGFEVDWFRRRLEARRLGPVCAISYLRTARVASERGETVRLTIDEDLRAAAADGWNLPETEEPLFPDGRKIVELKFSGEMPPLFKELLRSFVMERTRLSKYRTAASVLGLAEVHA